MKNPKDQHKFSFQRMVKKYADSSVVLIIATLLALVVANSMIGDAYQSWWTAPVNLSVGGFNVMSHEGHSMTLIQFINDFLMAIFFFSVGLEIKREVLVGELSSLRKAMLPIIGACGGMLVPVLVFWALCPADASMLRGVAIPMATDIAFSLGVLSLFGKRVPIGLKVFLAALAVADDLGGIIVIALFYSSELHVQYLLNAGVFVAILLAGNWLGVRKKTFYVSFGLVVWYMLLNSGIHATIAGVVVAFCVPASPRSTAREFVSCIREYVDRFLALPSAAPKGRKAMVLTDEQIDVLKGIETASDQLISPLQDMEDALRTPVNYFVIPLFAFANAGVCLAGMSVGSLFSGVGLAVFMGLLVGKVTGVFLFSTLSMKLGLTTMPAGADMKSFASLCMLTGIGFTVAMFIADLSYSGLGAEGQVLLNDAKLGILCGSFCSAVVSVFLLHKTLPAEAVAEVKG
ncbi:MAG: Na+/H+ antiporter NhaA [Clostridium sp.]|nr:Na+/H+ antiporter NhaA [Clostridium sp.]